MKKGISLITLVITIVVVIILAVAVILSLSKNNPINNARIANLVSTKDSIESGVLTYTSSIKAKTLGHYNTFEILSGGYTDIQNERIIEKNGEELITCTITKDRQEITLYKIDSELFREKIDKLPVTPNNKSEWYLDEYGKVYLVFEENGQAPKWMTNKENQMDDISLLECVTHKQNAVLGEGVTSGKVETPKELEWYEKIEEADSAWFNYSDNEDGTVSISGLTNNYPNEQTEIEIKLPTKNSDGKRITGIGTRAFYNKGNITKIYVPEGVTTIGDAAFYNCTAITEVYLPSTLSSISNVPNTAVSPFGQCKNITKITVPQYVINNDNSASKIFYYSRASIKQIEFSGIVTFIGTSAFDAFAGLESISSIPSTVTSIGTYAFRNCTSLSSITVPDSVESIEPSAFSGCKNATSLKLGRNLKAIGNSAFSNCSSIQNAIIPEGVTTIGDAAFYNCTAITEVYLPSTLSSISNASNLATAPFCQCKNITKITVPQYITGTVSVGNVFYYSKSSIKNIYLDENVTSIISKSLNGFSNVTLHFKGSIPDGSPWGATDATIVQE